MALCRLVRSSEGVSIIRVQRGENFSLQKIYLCRMLSCGMVGTSYCGTIFPSVSSAWTLPSGLLFLARALTSSDPVWGTCVGSLKWIRSRIWRGLQGMRQRAKGHAWDIDTMPHKPPAKVVTAILVALPSLARQYLAWPNKSIRTSFSPFATSIICRHICGL